LLAADALAIWCEKLVAIFKSSAEAAETGAAATGVPRQLLLPMCWACLRANCVMAGEMCQVSGD